MGALSFESRSARQRCQFSTAWFRPSLNTARRRVSVRRHARLVDYHLHDGCNARTWVHIRVGSGAGNVVLARGTTLLTRTREGAAAVIGRASREEREALAAGTVVFETAHEVSLHEACNELPFYTWGDDGCCLPRGATEATLLGHPPLVIGDVLLLVETKSPTTFVEGDADRSHRCAVRLTSVDHVTDPSGQLFLPSPVDAPLEVTRVAWAAADALPFALCLGVASRPGEVIGVALGNIVLADHGRSVIEDPQLPQVSDETRRYAPPSRTSDGCGDSSAAVVPVRYRPRLGLGPVTRGFELAELLSTQPNATGGASATEYWPAVSFAMLDPRKALPRIELETGAGTTRRVWQPRHDLLGSGPSAPHFIVETEHDGSARLRFGDDQHGERPNAGTQFAARYRVGNGQAGNVGQDALAQLVFDPALYDNPADVPDPTVFISVTNPLPAVGGVEPESVEAARRDAPQAFQTQERAVTPDDYARVSERSAEVSRAAATFRWTGSWYTVFVSADRPRGATVDAAFRRRLRAHLERFRMAGYDLEIDAPRAVPLDVALHVCVKSGYLRSDVLRDVERVLSSRMHSDGSRGLFHPDRFTFGDSVYLSSVVATAQAVTGVESVRVDRFRRLVNGSVSSLDEGVIQVGRLEIAELMNNPNFRERGRLTLSAGGGR